MICYKHFDLLESTQTWTKKHAASLDPNEITCITARTQTGGMGRFHRTWVSPPGENIYASLYFCLPLAYPFLANLGQILALACCHTLKECGFFPEIKWPNDILLNGKKVGGVLCEVLTLGNRLGVVLGIGLNVNTEENILASIDQPATSLLQESMRVWKREEILEPLLEDFLRNLDILSKQGFTPFHQTFNALLAFKGEQITCIEGDNLWEGLCESVNPDGTLNLLLLDGSKKALSAGEIT